MTDDEVRALIRTAIQKHLGGAGALPPAPVQSSPAVPPAPALISFARYPVVRITDDGMCLIEPAVKCNHCGYCECHGH